MKDQMQFYERLKKAGVIPVVKLDSAEYAVPLAKALLAGGIDIIEITFRTDAAAESIRRISEECPQMCVGAGTVLTREQIDQAKENGAVFCVAPGLNAGVVRYALEKDMYMLPGVMTPSEIEQGMELGLNVFKFFPAGAAGGIPMIKALRGPYHKVSFVPTGSVSLENMAEYLSTPGVIAIGGSFLADSKLIRSGNFARITEIAKNCSAAVAALRQEG